MNFIITQNGIMHSVDTMSLSITTNSQVYEVIRVIDGVALFLEDHYERLMASVQISGLHLEMTLTKFSQKITQLIKINRKQNGNVKFILSEEGKINCWSFSFISHSYPTPKDYQTGVATGLLLAERENPNAKVIQNTVREQANQLMKEKKLYEVLLVDRNGMITEGSRSNVFFVKEGRFYTAPASKILVGVTRIKVVDCLNELSFTLIGKAVAASEIGTFDAVFLTGTSPKVLPVHSIDNIQFEAKNAYVEKLMSQYDSMIEQYLKTHQQ